MRLSIIAVSMMTAMAFADAAKENICDALEFGNKFQLKSTIEEIYWKGNFRTMSAESSSSKKINSVNEADQVIKKSLVDNSGAPIKVPMALTAACAKTKNNEYKFVTCDKTTGACEQKTANNYATQIYDVRDIKVDGFTSENAYNLLIMAEDELPSGNTYPSGSSLMGSRTYDLAFEWWFAVAEVVVPDTVKKEDGTPKSINNSVYYISARSIDSASVFKTVKSSVEKKLKEENVLDKANSAEIRMLKVFLVEDKGTVPAGESSSSDAASSDSKDDSSSSVDQSSDGKGDSSSSVDQSSDSKDGSSSSVDQSSDSKGDSSSSVDQSSDSKDDSSSSVDQSSDSKDDSSSSVDQSSDSKDDSSSSEGSTFVKSFEAPSVGSEEVMMRRLDGTLVKNAKNAVPGVYYVKTANGLWKKKVVLPK